MWRTLAASLVESSTCCIKLKFAGTLHYPFGVISELVVWCLPPRSKCPNKKRRMIVIGDGDGPCTSSAPLKDPSNSNSLSFTPPVDLYTASARDTSVSDHTV